VTAQEALEMGLVNRVSENALEEAQKLAELILKNGPVAIGLAKEAIRRGLGVTLDQGLEVEADLFGLNASREPDGFADAIFKLAEYRKLEPGAIEEAFMFDHPSGYNRIFAAMRWKAENMR
ncbi:MAG: enoyl-CoA hydratase-related protein, partial [Usitatibacteraceae bacterium]